MIILDPDDIHSIALEIAMEQDRAYFKMHPNEKQYTRAPIANEYPAIVYEEGEIIEVQVHKINDVMRARLPVFRVANPVIQCNQRKRRKK